MEDYSDYEITILATKHPFADALGDLEPVEDVKIDPSNLQGEFLRHSELTAAYGYLHAIAEAEERRLEYKLERLDAYLDNKIREQLKAEEEKSTEPKIRKLIISNDSYRDLRLSCIDATKAKKLLKATLLALDAKMWALQSEGADRRRIFIPPSVHEDESD